MGESMQVNLEGDFKRGSTVISGINALDLGRLEKIRIGHNNSGFGLGWFLDKVIVRNESSGNEWYFLCGKWFATDGQIVRFVEASDTDGASYPPMRKYKISVITGDRRGAGTDANVFINLYGAEDHLQSGEKVLESSGNNFERGKQIFLLLNLLISVILKRLELVMIIQDLLQDGF